jgi:hypothetical protein
MGLGLDGVFRWGHPVAETLGVAVEVLDESERHEDHTLGPDCPAARTLSF